jgi:arginine-tRNA-protein transferase
MADADEPTWCAYPSIAPPVRVGLTLLPEHPCPYLPGRVAQYRGCRAEFLPPEMYRRFMDANFRRSGTILYQPVCRSCRLCIQIRVPTTQFAASKSQRRCWRRNQDLQVGVGLPQLTDEKVELYRRYVLEWHGEREEEPTADDLERFLYQPCTETREFTYRDPAGQLLAVGICDVSDRSLSSVYFYFDPSAASRGLGTFGVLYEIEWAIEREVPHYYLGYWVQGCATMDYKMSFHPAQLLGADGIWRDVVPR